MMNDPILCQENANASQEFLSRNPEITGLTEIVDFKSFHGTAVCSCRTSDHDAEYETSTGRGGSRNLAHRKMVNLPLLYLAMILFQAETAVKRSATSIE